MYTLGQGLVVAAAVYLAATWIGYPLWLWLRSGGRRPILPRRTRADWPDVQIVVIVRNAEPHLRALLLNLTALAYPAGRRRILVVSDASGDFTDAIAAQFAHRGVELLRLVRPMGRREAERIIRPLVDGDIVVRLDPGVRLAPWALAELVAPFDDPAVGVTYGNEAVLERADGWSRVFDNSYRRFEGWLRHLESRVSGTVSARGTLYAVRRSIYSAEAPAPWANADFALTLAAREGGCRAVFVEGADCLVARPSSFPRDYARLVAAVARDIATLLQRPQLLNPFRHGAFAWALLGHKILRWLMPWALLAGVAGMVILAPSNPWAFGVLAVGLSAEVLALAAALRPARTAIGRLATLPGRLSAAAFALAHAQVQAVRMAALQPEPAWR